MVAAGRSTEPSVKPVVSQPVRPPAPEAAPANHVENEDGWLGEDIVVGTTQCMPAAPPSAVEGREH